MTRIILILIEAEDRNHGSVYIHGLETCLNDRFAEAILAKLRECKLKPLSFTHLLGLLLKSGQPGGAGGSISRCSFGVSENLRYL